MNKLLKVVLSTMIVGVFGISSYASAITIETEHSETTKELIEMFPNYKKSIEEDTTGVLVGSEETYVKFIVKEDVKVKDSYSLDNLEDDFDVEYFTREEYKKEMSKSLLTLDRGIGNQEGGTTNWLRLDLQVYTGNGVSNYMAYNFSSWLTRPIFRFQDGIGISTSDGLIMSGDSSTRRAEYRCANPYSPIGTINKLAVSMNLHGNGVLATSYLQAANVTEAFPDLYEYHNWMIQTGVSYNNANVKEGWITGHYLHKQIALGSIGMDATGTPNISIGGSTDSHKGAIHVSR